MLVDKEDEFEHALNYIYNYRDGTDVYFDGIQITRAGIAGNYIVEVEKIVVYKNEKWRLETIPDGILDMFMQKVMRSVYKERDRLSAEFKEQQRKRIKDDKVTLTIWSNKHDT